MLVNIIVIIFITTLLYIGLKTKSKSNESSYLFIGRKLTLFPFIATLVSTWYGGILEIGRFSYQNGIVTWIIFGFSYYLAAYIFSNFIAPKIIHKKVVTIPEYFYKNYGKLSASISIIIVLFIASPAPYLKILANIFEYLWEISHLTAIIISALLSLIYIFNGGFNAVIKTDKIQFVLMYAGFIIILSKAYLTYGGIDFLRTNSPENALKIPGNLNWNTIFIWCIIALVTFIDPGFYQRTFSGQSLKTVQKGIKLSILCWIIFDGITIFTGIYASAILLDPINENPYLILSETLLSPFLHGIFMVSLISIVLSTIDSFSFISAYTIGRDLINIQKISFFLKPLSMKQKTQIGLITTSIISIFISYKFNYVINIWYTSGSFAISVLLLPMLLSFYNKKLLYPNINMISSLSITTIWFFYGIIHSKYGFPVYPFNLEPMYPGLITSIFIWIACEFIVRFKDTYS